MTSGPAGQTLLSQVTDGFATVTAAGGTDAAEDADAFLQRRSPVFPGR